MKTAILGLDPGLANCGLAAVELLPDGEQIIALDVFRSEKSAKKANVLDASDTLRRARELARWLAMWSSHLLDLHYDVRLLAAERFSAPRNASAAAKIGWAWGVIAALAEDLHIPVVQPSPQEVKRCVCGKRDASKEDVEAAMRVRFSRADDAIRNLEARIVASHREHAWDALAVVVASLDSDVVRAIRPRETGEDHG